MANKLNEPFAHANAAVSPRRRAAAPVLSLLFLIAAAGVLFADDVQNKLFAQRAQAAFDQTRTQYRSNLNNPVAAWQFARACYDWADWATNKSQRASIAREGIAACRQSLIFTNSAAGHYYMAMDMGQLAQCERLGALKLVREMEGEFLTAEELDAFDFAGPERNLGLLYRDAPRWPISIGNRSKTRKYLEQAVALAPGYPENILNLAESDLKWDDRVDAKKQLEALGALWPQARKHFTGEAWEQSWDDWTKRRDVLRQKLNLQ